MRITQQDITEFANWSGDQNPIHVDPGAAATSAFGSTIAHGALSTIKAFAISPSEEVLDETLSELDIEFRNEIRPDVDYRVDRQKVNESLTTTVFANDKPLLIARARIVQSSSHLREGSESWVAEALRNGTHTSFETNAPEEWNPENFCADQPMVGTHRFGKQTAETPSVIGPSQAMVLGLCSFIVGMKMPGLASLFTRLQVRFDPHDISSDTLAYRLTPKNYDPYFRILEMEMEVADPSGALLATAQIQSYVRFPLVEPDPVGYAGLPATATDRLAGKVVLVCGASRGLGAELAAGLGAMKSHVYLACRHSNDKVKKLADRIRTAGGTAKILIGDVGSTEWCKAALHEISQNHGRLDALLLNACEAPKSQFLPATSIQQSATYIERNLTLSQMPLVSFLPILSRSKGVIVGISSSFVEETPAGFADYVAVKFAMEGMLRTAAKEQPEVRVVIARPPRLRTSWNDTPSGAIGAISPRSAAATILQATALSFGSVSEKVSVVSDFTDLEPQTPNSKRHVDLAFVLAASFTLDPIHTAMEKWGQELDLVIQAELAPYAQILQQLLNPSSQLAASTGGSVVFLRINDWLREIGHGQTQLPNMRDWIRSTADEYIQAFKIHRGFAIGQTLLLICPSSRHEGLDVDLISETEDYIRDSLAQTPGLTVWKAQSFHSSYQVPEAEIFDSLREDIAHIPYKNAYYAILGTLAIRFFYRSLHPPKKVVVLDCDNTLWKGVVGEVGPEGVEFHPEHRVLHERLRGLAESGILLCLCSKNEAADVESVFATRSDFLLPKDLIIDSAVNWQPKSENIKRLGEKLNLGLDSFIFIDDNPIECSEVRTACPTVLTIQWPHESQEAIQLLNHCWELDIRPATVEDRQRTQLYKEEFHRQQVRHQTASFQEFLDSLQLEIEIVPLQESSLGRASQLTMRTNQFNLTTIRRSEGELSRLTDDPNYMCRTVSVRDRFGDYGLVGFLIARVGKALEVDTFLLSCRVLGRGVEHRMASYVAELAMSSGLDRVVWRYVPTERNTPAQMFLSTLVNADRWKSTDGGQEFSIDSKELKAFRFEVDQAETDQSEKEDKAGTQENAAVSSRGRDTKDMLRQRETQISRSARHLSSYSEWDAKSLGMGTGPATIQEADDIVAAVYQAFSKALRSPVEAIRKVDRLDALGCDSLRVVEITVALTREFPWLPKTLLFEHRSISEIVQAIQKVTTSGSGLPAATPDEPPVRAMGESIGDIAIVGIGIHCASVQTVDDFWQLLKQGRSGVVKVPRQRNSFVGKLTDDRDHFAGLIPDGCDFDAEFFGIAPREAAYMDPQLRLLLQTAWHALEDAGALEEGQAETGVYVGVMYSDYARFANVIGTRNGSMYRCWEGFSLANRLSQVLGCHGPSLAIDTACSSSATALHYACQSIRNGDCSSALVSGVNLIVDPNRLTQLGRLGILSASGHCVPFGQGADGTVLGEGAVTLVLRPLAEAKLRGDRIYAVIKGTGISSGAGSVGFTAPNPNAQAMAVRSALENAQVDPRTITYIETHGTGTELGDPIEVRGLQLAYCDKELFHDRASITHRCTIGSVKPNVGHLEAGAGLVGVAKTALLLHHATLVPSISSDLPNPHIDFASTPFGVQRELSSWTKESRRSEEGVLEIPRRAGVNSFGVGGSNVHIVLEEAPRVPRSTEQGMERSWHLLALSAPTNTGLELQANAWRTYVEHSGDRNVADACFSANVGRRKFARRTAYLCGMGPLESEGKGRVSFNSVSATQNPGELEQGEIETMRTAFLFSGQGSQYPGMLKQLYQQSHVFREAFDACRTPLAEYLARDLADVIFTGSVDDTSHCIHQTGYTQPALFAVQYALCKLWQSWGIIPDVLVGHSIGEVAAFCIGGGCDLGDALKLVEARGRLMQSLPTGGAMCSVAADIEVIREELHGESQVSVAAINGPMQTVLSGSREHLAKYVERFESRGIKVTPLAVSHAFHSHLMEPMLDEFAAVLSKLDLRKSRVPIVSTSTGEMVGDEMGTVPYWLEQVRNTVRLTDAMQVIGAQSISHFIEIGPHPVMLGMGRNCLAESSARWLPSARRGREDWPTILDSLGTMYIDGADIDWKGFDASYPRSRVSAPGYQFDKRRIWINELDAWEDSVDSAVHPAAATRKLQHYRVQWLEQDFQPRVSDGKLSATSHEPATWIVLSDSTAALRAFSKGLKDRGIPSIEVDWGIDDSILRADRPTSNESEFGSYWNAELRKIHQRAGGIRRIVWIDGPCQDVKDEPHRRAVDKLSSLCRILSSATEMDLPGRHLWIVTSKSIPDMEVEKQSIASTSLWGLARVASLDYPEGWGGIIDVEDLASQLPSVIDEIEAASDEDQIRLRHTGRMVPRLVEEPDRGPGEKLSIQSNEAVMVTGGLGGIGLRIVRRLAERGARKLIVVGRSQPSVSALVSLEEIRKLGAEVILVKADVSMEEGVSTAFGALGSTPLVGIVHAAGVDHIGPLHSASRDDIDHVLGGKANGAWFLHNASLSQPIRFFVFCSSIASVWGSAGRGLYAAANSFVDGLSEYRRRLGLPASSVHFGPWKGGGMADDQSIEQLSRIGNYGLEPAEVLDALEHSVAANESHGVLADVEWSRLVPIMEARRSRPMLSRVVSDSMGKETKADRSDRGDPMSKDSWIARVHASDDRQNLLCELISAEVASVLGLQAGGQSIAQNRSLFEIGMDSLTSAEFVAKIDRKTGLKCRSLLLEQPTIQAIAEKLLLRMDSPIPSAPAVETSAIVGYEASREKEIFEFCRRAWPKRQADWIEPRWKWMYLESARRVGTTPKVWLFRDENQLVGHHGAQFVKFKIGNEIRSTAWLVETMILASHREKGIGTNLVVQSKEELPFNLSLGQTEQMRDILEKLGWHRVAPLRTYSYLLEPVRVLQGKLPSAIAPLAAAWIQLRRKAVQLSHNKKVPTFEIRQIDRFAAAHDDLWDSVAQDYSCATVRDSSYLNWKYVDQPGQDFHRIGVYCEGKLTGIVVISLLEPTASYRYRRAMIVDMVSSSRPEHLESVIHAAVAHSRERNAAAVNMHVICPSIENGLESFGFLKRPATRYLLACVDRPLDLWMLSDPANWLVTQGDSDIDRPW